MHVCVMCCNHAIYCCVLNNNDYYSVFSKKMKMRIIFCQKIAFVFADCTEPRYVELSEYWRKFAEYCDNHICGGKCCYNLKATDMEYCVECNCIENGCSKQKSIGIDFCDIHSPHRQCDVVCVGCKNEFVKLNGEWNICDDCICHDCEHAVKVCGSKYCDTCYRRRSRRFIENRECSWSILYRIYFNTCIGCNHQFLTPDKSWVVCEDCLCSDCESAAKMFDSKYCTKCVKNRKVHCTDKYDCWFAV